MAEYINRDALIDSICAGCGWDGICTAKCIDLRTIRDFPAADVAPVVRGQWEEVEVEIAEDIELFPDLVTMRCGACKRYHTTVYFYGSGTDMMHFCPACGAKMEAEE